MKLAAILLMVALAAGCTGQATQGNAVEITSSGFNPKILKINAGEAVTFTNKDTKTHWPASAVHPTHSEYPEGGGCIGSAFDACGPLKTGESYSFTFNERGEWHYHDHLNSGLTGTIIVE
ncbi:MAG: cupredoxin domain-containing protein [Candidatus Micrarchaeota archaeon]